MVQYHWLLQNTMGWMCLHWIGFQLCHVHIVYLMSAAMLDKGRPAEQVPVDSGFSDRRVTFISFGEEL